MNRSTPGLPVHHQLPEFTQTHVHLVSDAIQPPHPLLSPSPLCRPLLLLPLIPPSIRVFSSESALRMRWPSTGVSGLASFFQRNTRADLLQNGLVGSPRSPKDSQESSPTIHRSAFFTVQLAHPYMTTGKNHSLD